MSLYQLFSLLIIPAIITIFCYQAVIRVLWRSVKYELLQYPQDCPHAIMCRDVQGLTGVSGAGANSGVTIRCHHFILHQDREISVRSVLSNFVPSFISSQFCYCCFSLSTPSDSHAESTRHVSRHVDTVVSHARDKESMNLTTLNIPENLKFCSCKQFR